MDPLTTSTLLSVVGNALWTVLLRIGKDVSSLAQLDRSAVNDAIMRAKAETLDAATDFDPDERLIIFATSAEAEGIVRHLFANELASEDITAIKETFVRLGRAATNDRVEPRSIETLFDIYAVATSAALTAMIDDSALAAHDAKSSLRFRLLREEIRTLGRSLESPGLDINAIASFEEDLRKHIESDTRYIVPPYLDAQRRVPINKLYVSPTLAHASEAESSVQEAGTDSLLSDFHRAVVLGNPGGGKSTLAQKLAFDVATRRGERLVAGRDLTPAIILLRDFGARHKEAPISLREYLEMQATTKYQLSPPEGAFEHLLCEGRIFLVLDGLDELIDTSYRRDITTAVEHFAVTYPAVPMLVTSREVGYSQAPLDAASFTQYRLSHFSAEQASSYVDRWFEADPQLNHDERKRIANAFNAESASVPDLRENPLMLGLLCNIYRGENWIPRNRPDVYEKCALMLFERWDRQRGIVAFDSFESHLRPAMEFLAHWIFGSQERQAGVVESELVSAAAEYLHEHRYADKVDAVHAAQKFISFCRGRAWVFTDTGTQPDGARLFQFTHRTFLEYFTAVHLSRTHPLPSDLLSTLRPRIAAGEWDVVSQLAVQIKNRAIEGAADEILLSLLPLSSDGVKESLSLSSFAARTLGFLVPKPDTTFAVAQAVTGAIIDSCLDGAPQTLDDTTDDRFDSPAGSTLRALTDVGTENLSTVVDATEAHLRAEICHSDNERRRSIAAEIALNPLAPVRSRQESHRPWREMTERLLTSERDVLIAIGSTDWYIGCDLYWFGICDIDWHLEMHGTSRLFTDRTYRVATDVSRISFFRFAADQARFAKYECPLDEYQAAIALSRFGEVLLGATFPWHVQIPYMPNRYRQEARQVKQPEAPLDGHALFAYAFAACVFAERRRQLSWDNAGWESLALPPVLWEVADLRGKPAIFETRRAELASLGLASTAIELLAAWSAEAVTFSTSDEDSL